MSVKNNALAILALGRLGFNPVLTTPIAEGLLNDFPVASMRVVQVDQAGRCVVSAYVASGVAGALEDRFVCSASGDIKVYGAIENTVSLVKRAKAQNGALSVSVMRLEKVGSVGDPINTLKAQYKSFKAENLTAQKSLLVIAAKITAGAALGWDEQVGTPEADEYADYTTKQAAVTEWQDYCAGRVTAIAAALTAAGVDPLTVV